jgi:anion-transporting  ArsA/GET3 family ATPase
VSQLAIIDDLLRSRKILFVTGKGGIGKSLVSCALARRAEAIGLRVLLVEHSFVEQLGSVVGIENVVHEEHWSGGFGVANFTAAGNLKDFVSKHLMKSSILDVIVSNKIVNSFFTAIPGFSELTLLGRMYYASNLGPVPRPDIIIFDGYASGHFMSLMTTPDAVIKSGLVGSILNLTSKVRNWLATPNVSATVYVAVPEDLVMSEALDFLPELAKKSPSPLAAVIVNRCLENTGDDAEEDGGSLHAFMADRRIRQEKAMARFTKGIAGFESLRHLPVLRCPELGAVSEPIDAASVKKILGGLS